MKVVAKDEGNRNRSAMLVQVTLRTGARFVSRWQDVDALVLNGYKPLLSLALESGQRVLIPTPVGPMGFSFGARTIPGALLFEVGSPDGGELLVGAVGKNWGASGSSAWAHIASIGRADGWPVGAVDPGGRPSAPWLAVSYRRHIGNWLQALAWLPHLPQPVAWCWLGSLGEHGMCPKRR